MDSLDRYAPLETALHEAGFKVDEVQKQGKKTIITVTKGQIPAFIGLKPVPTAASPEEQGANGLLKG
jgi:hypothetical protein